MSSTQQLLQEAMDHHRAGRLAEAAEFYGAVLRLEPDETDALYLLGLVAHQSGDQARAVELIERSLAIEPDQPQCHNVLGLALMRMGRHEEAATRFARAIEMLPAAEFHNNLGNCRKEQGRLADAVAAYLQALILAPDFADAHYNLANAHRAANRPQEAMAGFRRAIELEPNHANALAALGQVLQAGGRAAEAIPFLERAVALAREDAELYCDLGDALQALGRRQEAIARYQKALRLNPALARAWFAAGCAEQREQDYASAALCFRKAVEAAPEWQAAHHNLADSLFQLGQVDEALAHFRQAAATGPSELPRAMIAVVIPGAPSAGNREIMEARRDWVEHDLPAARPAARFAPRASSGGPVRVGYLSSFFQHDHWMKPVWGLINRHDRRRVALHLFSDAPESAIGPCYRRHPDDRVHDISGLSNAEAAAAIERAELDLLVDLNGYSKIRRLEMLAMRPAPRVAAWFNLFATSGMTAFDYLVGDTEVIPPEEEKFYCETIVRVPGSYLAFEVGYPVPPVSRPPCLDTRSITFGCLASQYKITSAVVSAWSRILLQAPRSRLIVRNVTLGAAGVREFVLGVFASSGIAAERIELFGPADHFRFLEAYARIDVALDTFPYNGGTTTTEAIWQGVPVVAFHGDRWASRTSASILRAGKLGEFVCSSLDDYVALAVRLATAADTPEYLADLRSRMRARLAESPVCDTAAFARNMESLYERMANPP